MTIKALRDYINAQKDPKKEMEEFKSMLQEAAIYKKNKCVKTRSNGEKYFDYLEMSKMYHRGEW